MFAHALHLNVLKQVHFSKWFLRKPMELFKLWIFSWIEFSSWRDLFSPLLVLVLVDLFFWWRFLQKLFRWWLEVLGFSLGWLISCLSLVLGFSLCAWALGMSSSKLCVSSVQRLSSSGVVKFINLVCVGPLSYKRIRQGQNLDLSNCFIFPLRSLLTLWSTTFYLSHDWLRLTVGGGGRVTLHLHIFSFLGWFLLCGFD